MKSILTILKSHSLALGLICISNIARTQTVTIAGTQPVEVGCEYQYTATVTNTPSDWTVVDYKWQATYVGTTGIGKIRYVSSFDNNGNPVFTTVTAGNGLAVIAKTKDFWVTWDNTFYPTCQLQVIFVIRYTKPTTGTAINLSQEFNMKGPNNSNFFCLKGIPTNLTFTGPATVQKCCLSNVTYTASNYGDANTFDNWTYPAGWTLVSQTGNSITLTPNASTGGNITCRVGLTTACPPIYKTALITVTRNDAVITTIASQFPLNRICPNSTYSFAVNPVCGVTDYSWQFPAGFTITGYTNNKTVANISTGATITSGNVTITALFNGCNSVSLSVPITAITGAPAQAPVFDIYAPQYHCNAWYVCRNGNYITLAQSSFAIDVQTFTYTVSSPWYFRNAANQKVNSLTLPYIETPPSIFADVCRTTGNYSVRANNCLGSSTPTSIIFYQESECWCLSTPPFPYSSGDPKPCLTAPSGCGLCTQPVPTRITVFSTDAKKGNTTNIVEAIIYPNPANGVVTIKTKNLQQKRINIVSSDGNIVFSQKTSLEQLKIDVSRFKTGIYIIEIIENLKTRIVGKIAISKE
jgi:Secretion system C-terminal sorting domain/PKD-like domain